MSAPRPFDLSDPAEMERLHWELEGYMRVSLKDGTDTEGRAHAYAALCDLNRSKRPAYGTPVPAETIVGAMPIND